MTDAPENFGPCTEEVEGTPRGWGHYYPCKFKAVDARGLCGVHLRAAEKKAQKDRQYEEDHRRSEEIRALAERISETLETKVEAHYDNRTFRYTGKMVVSSEFLLDLVKKRLRERGVGE